MKRGGHMCYDPEAFVDRQPATWKSGYRDEFQNEIDYRSNNSSGSNSWDRSNNPHVECTDESEDD